MSRTGSHRELRKLLELYCENELSPQQTQRLEELARESDESLQFYLDYIDLHGNLIWDVAGQPVPSQVTPEVSSHASQGAIKLSRRPAVIATMTACLAIAVIAAFLTRDVAKNETTNLASGTDPVDQTVQPPTTPRSVQPLDLPVVANDSADKANPENNPTDPPSPTTSEPMESNEIVAAIDTLLRNSWKEAGIEPSPAASPTTIARRLHLNILGRIPTNQELNSFRETRSQAAIASQLLANGDHARFWASNWTNLLIGRRSERGVNRPGFEKFLRDRFASNEPWNQTVSELIAAEGTTEDNGATNFLVAHLNSQAVPATAVTARAFLGIQVQCTQCHDHPFNSSWKQDQFWSLNSFFKQTKRERQFSDALGPQFRLTSKEQGGPTHYETRNGLMVTAFPKYGDREVDPGPDTNRRAELAKIVTTEDTRQLAKAMVNRVWAHLFGFGFTTPIDDMGPHNPPSHPKLLNLLAEQFEFANFDLRKLVTWIVSSEAYALDSTFHPTGKNSIDAPSRGETPLFSRMYVRSMSPEQVYDSLLIATRASESVGFDWENANRKRHEWIQQFLFAHENEENTEASTFNGSITQAMSLMNSDLIAKAVSFDRGTLLSKIIGNRTAAADQLTAICQAVLSREPSEVELTTFRRLLRRERTAEAKTALLQDVLWAYLNSNEFILVH
ncbi:MAG: DUF1549 domain-containing protein [Planctomycetaceae bacterium]